MNRIRSPRKMEGLVRLTLLKLALEEEVQQW